MGEQIKSKQRVADHGEVLTGKCEVNAMLDLVKQETERQDDHVPRSGLQVGRVPARDRQAPRRWAGEANPRPANATQPHLQESTVRSVHHGVNLPAFTPLGVLLQNRQREVFRLRALR